jgi:hypothetical protein
MTTTNATELRGFEKSNAIRPTNPTICRSSAAMSTDFA